MLFLLIIRPVKFREMYIVGCSMRKKKPSTAGPSILIFSLILEVLLVLT